MYIFSEYRCGGMQVHGCRKISIFRAPWQALHVHVVKKAILKADLVLCREVRSHPTPPPWLQA